MGWFSGVTNLFGTSKTLDKTLELGAKGIYNGLDKLFYTEEEKADRVENAGKLFMKYAEKTMDENSIRSVTRRWLAFIVVFPTMFTFFLGSFIVAFSEQTLQAGQTSSGEVLLNAAIRMMPYAAGVLVFYFGPHMLGLMGSTKK